VFCNRRIAVGSEIPLIIEVRFAVLQAERILEKPAIMEFQTQDWLLSPGIFMIVGSVAS